MGTGMTAEQARSEGWRLLEEARRISDREKRKPLLMRAFELAALAEEIDHERGVDGVPVDGIPAADPPTRSDTSPVAAMGEFRCFFFANGSIVHSEMILHSTDLSFRPLL